MTLMGTRRTVRSVKRMLTKLVECILLVVHAMY